MRGVFEEPFPEWARLIATVTGWDVDADELRSTARRIVRAKRAFNQREGATAADDRLPARMLSTAWTAAGWLRSEIMVAARQHGD